MLLYIFLYLLAGFACLLFYGYSTPLEEDNDTIFFAFIVLLWPIVMIMCVFVLFGMSLNGIKRLGERLRK